VVLKLAEYEFEVVHRPGKKHVNADVLSRHVAAAVRKQNDSHYTQSKGKGRERKCCSPKSYQAGKSQGRVLSTN
jgi:hypothetical protein